MAAVKNGIEEKVIKDCAEAIRAGSLPSWKVEDEVLSQGIIPPENYRIAALCRRQFIQEETGERFQYIRLSEKPFKIRHFCEKDQFTWDLDARDEEKRCSLCGSELKSLGQHSPLVANYVGGTEGYYSYAGHIEVKGDLEKKFTNLLVYGTGLGPIGITRSSYFINRFGGAHISVSEYGRAARCLGFIFKKEEARHKAVQIIETYLPELRPEMNEKMKEFSGRIGPVEFFPTESQRGFILYVDFTADFSNFRGHGALSSAVGYAKKKIDAKLQDLGLNYELSVIAQGFDGDLKPSPRNKRGRCVSACLKIPAKEFEDFFDLGVQKFLSFVELDCIGAQKLGCQFYSGMGGEIIPAIYKATRVNPHSSLVSSFQHIRAWLDKGNLLYEIELPNLEVGIASSREGLIPPAGREALRIMGIRTAKEFAAAVASQVLAGEFNLALEIARERLYG